MKRLGNMIDGGRGGRETNGAVLAGAIIGAIVGPDVLEESRVGDGGFT